MRLNIIPKTGTGTVSCSQGDTAARMFSFEMYKNTEPWTIDADSVTMEISNGASVAGTFSGNVAEFDCTASISATAGNYFGKLKFEKSASVLYSASFIFNVERSA